MLKERQRLFNPVPTKILWFYQRYFRDVHEILKNEIPEIQFFDSFDYEYTITKIEESPEERHLLILDDCLQSPVELELIFTRYVRSFSLSFFRSNSTFRGSFFPILPRFLFSFRQGQQQFGLFDSVHQSRTFLQKDGVFFPNVEHQFRFYFRSRRFFEKSFSRISFSVFLSLSRPDYVIFTSSITDILSVKNRAIQTFATSWRYMFEIFSLICLEKYQYLILNNTLKKTNLDFRIYSQIFEGEQLVYFKKIGALV